ncbi:hypothetical protein CLAIMM_02130 [Cladophialophora immunda]|nr:hypothetical protein CLAIMM_02130 [Cladophialophora immunda]
MVDHTFKYFTFTTPQEWIGHVEINRPETLNAFFEDMLHELRDIFKWLSSDADTRVVILSGAGPRAFSTGIDVKRPSAKVVIRNGEIQDPARRARQIRRHVMDVQDCVSSIECCEKPVICIMHGYTLGLAIDISASADIRICTKDAIFSVKEVDLGLAADAGALQRLPSIVGSLSWVKDVCYTGRRFGAEEALSVGYVSSISKDKQSATQEAIKLAANIASKSQIAVLGTKELLNYGTNHDASNGLRYTSLWSGAMLQTRDISSAVNAMKHRKKATFANL